MPFSITKILKFDAAHRVLLHESKCRHLHGHTYTVDLEVTADKLDPLGRVIDFSVLKTVVGGWIDANLDHNILLHPDDPLLAVYRNPTRAIEGPTVGRSAVLCADILDGKIPFIMPEVFANPTAENIAGLLFHKAEALLLGRGISVVSVTVGETETCFACYDQDDASDIVQITASQTPLPPNCSSDSLLNMGG